MNKLNIKNFAVFARRKLISDVVYKAKLLGITENGVEEYHGISLSAKEIAQRSSLIGHIKEKNSDYKIAFESVMEEVAYMWFNRLIAIRFMEINGYLPSKVRVLSSEVSGKIEPDIVTKPYSSGIQFLKSEKLKIECLIKNDKLNELFMMLFIKQCNKLNDILPEFFEKTADYTEILLNISFTDTEGVVFKLIEEIDEETFKDEVEIIGWLYQYYNSEPKDQVFALLKKNIKVTKERIPAATQLFTPHWLVKYMVENSLGRLWMDLYGDVQLKDKWDYFVENAEQDGKIQAQLNRVNQAEIGLEEIKIIDPCMGSGHILVYAFDVLMQLYLSKSYTKQEAVKLIIKNNLYGLDIDERVYQLAYFSIMMKARQYDEDFFEHPCSPQLYCPVGYDEGENFGSLLVVNDLEEKPEFPFQSSLFDFEIEKDLNRWNFKRLLSQKYDIVITNPPYMGKKSLNNDISKYMEVNYNHGKTELYAAFIMRCIDLTKENGFTAMITIHTWMFISSFANLRNHVLNNTTITSMVHTGPSTFEELNSFNVLATAFCLKKAVLENYKTTFIRLVDFLNTKEKSENFHNQKLKYILKLDDFSVIPSKPFVYWVSDNARNNFQIADKLRSFAEPKQGLATADNERFVRFWFEVDENNFCKNAQNSHVALMSKAKWFPYNKGGNFRKWYGMNEYVVNWQDNGYEIKNFKDSTGYLKSRPQNLSYYFKKGITWSLFGFENFGVRYKDNGFVFDVSGSSIFSNKDVEMYILAFLSSKVAFMYLSILAPTVNFQVGNIGDLPLIIDDNIKEEVECLAKECIDISREEWDDFEQSWNFKNHPLCYGEKSIKIEFEKWKEKANSRYEKLRANEERINQLFISVYNVQNDVSINVIDRDIALRKADVSREIKSFISFAVANMFGRYSSDKAYDCLILTKNENLENDIINLFVNFVKKIYGEETLEENLEFIAKSIDIKGKNSRDIIRTYFIKEFYKDHVKIYQKTPIYWMFDSGKENAFKALIYMKQYNENTMNLIYEYLVKIQSANTKQNDELKIFKDKVANLAQSGVKIDLDDGVKFNYKKIQTAENGKVLNVLQKIKK